MTDLPANIDPPAGVDIKELEKAFDGDLDLFLFFVTWLKNGMDGTKAYLELHPNVTPHSARVLGSRWLARVSRDVVMSAYGLGTEKYLQQLQDGLEATKWNDFTGEREADHKTRREYHKVLGQILGIEKDAAVNIQGDKVLVIPSELIAKYGITPNTKDRSERQP